MIRTCLAKDRDDRWASAHDVLLQFEWIARDGSACGTGNALPAACDAATFSHGRPRAWLVATAGYSGRRALAPGARGAPPGPLRLAPARATSPGGGARLSRDGRHLAFVGHDAAGRRLLYLRSLDAFGVAQPLAGTDGRVDAVLVARQPGVGLLRAGKLKRIDVATARIQTLADAAGLAAEPGAGMT